MAARVSGHTNFTGKITIRHVVSDTNSTTNLSDLEDSYTNTLDELEDVKDENNTR